MIMKQKLFAVVAMTFLCLAGYAQDINQVDRFDVGPYVVDYWGKGDISYKLKKGIDLIDFFQIKKDTVFVVQQDQTTTRPVKQAFWGGVQVTPRNTITEFMLAAEGGYKRQIAPSWYVNAGANLGLHFINRGTSWDEGLGKALFIVGLPVTAEWSQLQYGMSSLFVEAGLIPAFYVKPGASENAAGFLIGPKAAVGAYIPVAGKMIRLGGFGQAVFTDSAQTFVGGPWLGRFFFGYSLDLLF